MSIPLKWVSWWWCSPEMLTPRSISPISPMLSPPSVIFTWSVVRLKFAMASTLISAQRHSFPHFHKISSIHQAPPKMKFLCRDLKVSFNQNWHQIIVNWSTPNIQMKPENSAKVNSICSPHPTPTPSQTYEMFFSLVPPRSLDANWSSSCASVSPGNVGVNQGVFYCSLFALR